MADFELLDVVVLDRDLPQHNLQRGDLGAVVECLAPDVYEVEFVAASGETKALVTLQGSDLRAVGERDMLAVRHLAS